MHDPKQSITFDYYRDPYTSNHYPSKGPSNGGTLLKAEGFGFALHRPHLVDKMWARFVNTENR